MEGQPATGIGNLDGPGIEAVQDGGVIAPIPLARILDHPMEGETVVNTVRNLRRLPIVAEQCEQDGLARLASRVGRSRQVEGRLAGIHPVGSRWIARTAQIELVHFLDLFGVKRARQQEQREMTLHGRRGVDDPPPAPGGGASRCRNRRGGGCVVVVAGGGRNAFAAVVGIVAAVFLGIDITVDGKAKRRPQQYVGLAPTFVEFGIAFQSIL